jgi:L-ascorbate metabolism protein UlaG (beta-lactamase superfamily)
VIPLTLAPDTTITWYGHSCWEVRTPGGRTILLDPWFGNPRSPWPTAI